MVSSTGAVQFTIFCMVLTMAFSKSSTEPPKTDRRGPKSPFRDMFKNNQDKEESLKISARQLLEQLGTNTRSTLEESVYNETETGKICFKTIFYVNESNGVLDQWREYQVDFDFPSEGVNIEEPEKDKKYIKHNIRTSENEPRRLLNFEVIVTEPTYTISKRENVTCGTGHHLTKSYYEWPQTGKKKIVLKLAVDASESFNDQSDEQILEAFYSDFEEKAETETPMDQADKRRGITGQEMLHTGRADLSEMVEDDAGEPFENQNLTSGTSNDTVLVPVEPCSPMLTQLLSGNGILSGLCQLRKNEKVMLQGDIVVSKKYYNEQNHQELVKPLFVIHENTEIEASANITKLEAAADPSQ